MPLMMVLSGYAFQIAYVRDSAVRTDGVKKQLFNFVWCYVLFTVLKVAGQQLVPGALDVEGWDGIPRSLYRSLNELWYLYVMVFLYVLAVFLIKRRMRMERLIAFSAVACMLYPLYGVLTDWTIVRVPLYLVYFSVGMYLRQNDERLTRKGLLVTGVISVAYLSYTIVLAILGEGCQHSALPIIGPIGAMSVSLFVINMASMIAQKDRVFSLIGRYSLEVFLIHNNVVALLRVLLPRLGIAAAAPQIVVSLLTAVYLPILGAFVMKKIGLHAIVFKPYSVLFGKARYRKEAA